MTWKSGKNFIVHIYLELTGHFKYGVRFSFPGIFPQIEILNSLIFININMWCVTTDYYKVREPMVMSIFWISGHPDIFPNSFNIDLFQHLIYEFRVLLDKTFEYVVRFYFPDIFPRIEILNSLIYIIINMLYVTLVYYKMKDRKMSLNFWNPDIRTLVRNL